VARIVLTTFGSFGDIQPYIALALALRERGHSPIIATSEMYRDRVEAVDLPLHPVRPNLTEAEILSHMRPTGDPNLDTAVAMRDILFPQSRATYEDLYRLARDADMLVSHLPVFAAPLVAAKTGIRWVSCVLSPRVFVSAYEPSADVPASDQAKLIYLSPQENGAARELAKQATVAWAKPIERLRKQLGLPRGKHAIFEEPHSRELVLALFSPLFGSPQPDWPARTLVTGFLQPHETAIDRELERFLEAGPAPIVFSLGSDSDNYAAWFFVESVAAAKLLHRRAVLVGLGASLFSTESIFGIDYAPYWELFRRAAAVVHHAGVGTAALALRAGCPMLAVPHSTDQPDNAARLERLGVARVIARPAYRARLVALELAAVLGAPRYLAQAAQISRLVQSEDGASVACDAIEEVLRRQ
jgi:UDP:flavonoid glycosyltransferase YjiC (YdhE family)